MRQKNIQKRKKQKDGRFIHVDFFQLKNRTTYIIQVCERTHLSSTLVPQTAHARAFE